MGKIVCATRGGEGSRDVQLAAIERAERAGQPLAFIYVVSTGSLGSFDHVLQDDVQEELTFMGKTLLRIAQRRARQAGVEAEMVILDGVVEEQIDSYLQESRASLLLIGAPRGDRNNVFAYEELSSFARRVEETTGVPVEIVRPAVA